jgi:putative ABC transport system permease protein
VRGLFKIAFKLLTNDRGKFLALLVGITFAVFLIVEMMSVFAGILLKASSTVANTGAKVWVMDPAVNSVQGSIPLPDYVLDAVRSAPGVKYAVPLYTGSGLVKLRDGTFQAVNVLGLDDTSLYGRPEVPIGDIQDLYSDDAFVVVEDSEYAKLGRPKIGTEFEINDHRGVVVGIARVPSSGLFGLPTLYTTFSRAVEDVPGPRYTISFILVEPDSPADVPGIKQSVGELGYMAKTEAEFEDLIADFYKYRTGLGVNILLMTVISFIVGLSISGQTFYSFTIENLERFGALKAIGAKGSELVAMILFQAGSTALAGYGLGIGLCAVMIAAAKLRLPDYASVITFWNLGVAFLMVIVIATLSSYIAIRKVLRIDPFDIFRS